MRKKQIKTSGGEWERRWEREAVSSGREDGDWVRTAAENAVPCKVAEG